jgi:type IV secretion system protein VirD4
MNEHSYTATFAKLSSVTGLFNHGLSLNGSFWWATNKEIAYRNALIVGPSGSGKTSTVLIGSIHSIARGKSSMAILDVSGEVHSLTSGWLRKKGYKVYVINFAKNSDSFNALLLCQSRTDVQKVAFLLIKNSNIESKSDPYWSASAEMMLSVFIEYLVFYAEKQYCSMANLVRLADMFAAEPRKVDKLFVRTGDEDLIMRYKAMNAVSEKTLQSTLATVRTAIKVFGTPEVRNATATNTIDFSKFRTEKSVLYICTPLNEVNYYAPLSALLFEALFKQMLSRIPERHEHSIFCLIDELASLKFQNPGLVWANCRKFSSTCVGIIQSPKMLEMCCSPVEAHSIIANSYFKLYLPGQDLSVCKQIEEICGKYSFLDDHGIERTRSLITASEVRQIEDAIVIAGNMPPIRTKLCKYYESFILNSRSKLPPYVNSNTSVEPPLLPFDEA